MRIGIAKLFKKPKSLRKGRRLTRKVAEKFAFQLKVISSKESKAENVFDTVENRFRLAT